MIRLHNSVSQVNILFTVALLESFFSSFRRSRPFTQDRYFHSYAKSLLRRKKGQSSRGRNISSRFKQMRNIVGKDKNRKNKSYDAESALEWFKLLHSSLLFLSF